jgi:hypothetical protein
MTTIELESPADLFRGLVGAGLVFGALVFALSGDVVQFEASKECRGAFSSGFGGGFETRHCAVVVRKTGSDEKIRIPFPQ